MKRVFVTALIGAEKTAWLLEGRGSERSEEKIVVLSLYIYVQDGDLKFERSLAWLPSDLSTLILLIFDREELESIRRSKIMQWDNYLLMYMISEIRKHT